jgi:WD40 repeat protein
VGTSHGLVVIFDHFQELKLVLGMRDGVEYGPIYAVDISFESDWIACGHAAGPVVVWDAVTGDQIRAFIGEYSKPITYIRFIDNKRNRLLTCSLDGVMKLLHVRSRPLTHSRLPNSPRSLLLIFIFRSHAFC